MGITDYGKSLRPRVQLENPLDRIQNYLSEGSTEAAKEMEYVLVHAAGGKQESQYKNLKKYTDKLGFNEPLDVGKKIIDGSGS